MQKIATEARALCRKRRRRLQRDAGTARILVRRARTAGARNLRGSLWRWARRVDGEVRGEMMKRPAVGTLMLTFDRVAAPHERDEAAWLIALEEDNAAI